MHFTSLVVAALLSVAQAVDVQVVNVGKNPANNVTALKYWPENIKAEVGTMVQFQFWAGNHTVTQSSFDNPCTPLAVGPNGTAVTGIRSGFQAVAASAELGQIPVYTIMINDTSPLWFYCAQGTHCQAGMSLVINENTQATPPKTLVDYKANAAGSTGGGGNADSGNGSGGEVPGSEVPGGEIPGDEQPVRSAAPSLSLPSAALLALGTTMMLFF